MAGTKGVQVSEADCADHHHGQMCLQGCTLASTTVVLGQLGETTALLKQVLSIHQQGPVRQRSCSLSLHLQIEPANLSSQTRVGFHPR